MNKLLLLVCLFSAGCAGMNGQGQGRVAEQSNPAASTGAAVYAERECAGCHSISGVGGTLGPDLTKIGATKSKEWLAEQIEDPKSRNSASIMPAYKDLSTPDLNALVDYLATLK
ncbi:MAG: c-type cytochrome [Geobacteraceae bacterium]